MHVACRVSTNLDVVTCRTGENKNVKKVAFIEVDFAKEFARTSGFPFCKTHFNKRYLLAFLLSGSIMLLTQERSSWPGA